MVILGNLATHLGVVLYSLLFPVSVLPPDRREVARDDRQGRCCHSESPIRSIRGAHGDGQELAKGLTRIWKELLAVDL